MAERPLIVTESLGGSSLSRAARSGDAGPHWYRPLPNGGDVWRSYAREVAASAPADWLEELRGAIQPSGAAAQRIERVAAGKGVVVTTGQQPGLFGGPLMTFVFRIISHRMGMRTGLDRRWANKQLEAGDPRETAQLRDEVQLQSFRAPCVAW